MWVKLTTMLVMTLVGMAVLSLHVSTTDELGEGVPGKIVEPQAQELST